MAVGGVKVHVVVYGQRVSSGSWVFSTLYLLQTAGTGNLDAFLSLLLCSCCKEDL